MMYAYMTLADGTEIVHSQLLEKDGKKVWRCILSGQQRMALTQRAVHCRPMNG